MVAVLLRVCAALSSRGCVSAVGETFLRALAVASCCGGVAGVTLQKYCLRDAFASRAALWTVFSTTLGMFAVGVGQECLTDVARDEPLHPLFEPGLPPNFRENVYIKVRGLSLLPVECDDF